MTGNMSIKNNFSIILCVCMMLCHSCAHKSGHNRKEMSSQRTRISQVEKENEPTNVHSSKSKKKPDVEVSSNNDKFDGPTIFSKYGAAVFMVVTSDGDNLAQGSGFFINNSGLAVSNYHVFKGTYKGKEAIKLMGSNDVYNVMEVIAKDEDNDFIIFRVNISGNRYIPLARSKPRVGEKVYAIGSPRQLENTLSSGEVSGWRGDNYMQISVPIDHGSSGGALINENGQAVGITTAGIEKSGANLNFAISIDVIKPYVNIK